MVLCPREMGAQGDRTRNCSNYSVMRDPRPEWYGFELANCLYKKPQTTRIRVREITSAFGACSCGLSTWSCLLHHTTISASLEFWCGGRVAKEPGIDIQQAT